MGKRLTSELCGLTTTLDRVRSSSPGRFFCMVHQGLSAQSPCEERMLRHACAARSYSIEFGTRRCSEWHRATFNNVLGQVTKEPLRQVRVRYDQGSQQRGIDRLHDATRIGHTLSR